VPRLVPGDQRHDWETDTETGLPVRFHERTFGPYVNISQRERVMSMRPVVLEAPRVRLGIDDLKDYSVDRLREMAEQLAAAVVECERVLP